MVSIREFGGGEVFAWRLSETRFAAIWDRGEGAFVAGGRWNSAGRRAVYCSLDPSTAILEVAVHRGFKALDTISHQLTAARIHSLEQVHVVDAATIPNPSWLRPGVPGAGQQTFGDTLLTRHAFIAIPSVASPHSWSLIFDPEKASGAYSLRLQEAFALDTRLHPPPSS